MGAILIGLVVIALGALVVWAALREPPSEAVRPGTRAFEAALSLPLLEAAIEDLKQRHAAELDDKKRDRLARELVHLELQVPHLRMLIDTGDSAPGHGFIGFDRLPDDPD
ncbi:MAG: hypothetical protein ACOZQL_24065 [Myxococcota bacterium]